MVIHGLQPEWWSEMSTDSHLGPEKWGKNQGIYFFMKLKMLFSPKVILTLLKGVNLDCTITA